MRQAALTLLPDIASGELIAALFDNGQPSTIEGILGFVFLISYMFMMTDVEAPLEDATGYPHIWMFSQAVPKGDVVVLNAVPTILFFAGTPGFNLSTSRQIWPLRKMKGFLNMSTDTHIVISLNVASLFITYIFSIGATSTTLSFYRAAGGRWGDLEFW
ncbi:hypothetical protein PMIN04_002681 [Paraphaeosphaeria minitans]|uniref:Uncharacterized protein n=1 Tax=Paraphaeosphaeria minitans TaxID=565426 RepID=A0A9P6GKY6_9PLEO|nr:hypothetical protein PMIN01_05326 [Paraphaeosphaeria minitans]